MKIIKITGGIGAGKSLCGKALLEWGEIVIDADIVARKYSPAAARENAAEIFANPEKLRALEDLVHPLVAKDIAEQAAALEKQGRQRIFVLVPALGRFAVPIKCDCTIAVVADRELRIERVMARSNLSRGEVEARMRAQAADAEIMHSADAVLYNNGTKEELIKELQKTYNNLV